MYRISEAMAARGINLPIMAQNQIPPEIAEVEPALLREQIQEIFRLHSGSMAEQSMAVCKARDILELRYHLPRSIYLRLKTIAPS